MRKPRFGVRGLVSGAVGCFLLAASTSVSAASGDLDPSFGTGGKVTTDLGGGFADAYALAQQSDGKIVAVGHTTVAVGDDFALVRYRTDGSLDPGFGTGGVVTTDFFGVFDHANAVALQRDGRIVAAGSAFSGSLPGHDDFALARYRTNGSLDPTFGTGGKVTTSIGEFNRAWAVAVQHDGRIVVAGYASGDFALARYDRNGALDPSFGTGGVVTTDFGGFAYASAVTLQPTGRIVAVGRATVAGNPSSDVALARYRSDGALDATFGTGGRVTTDFGGDDQAYAVGLQRHGRIVVAGTSLTGPTNNDFALARYRSDGSLDSAFGAGGRVTTDFAGSFDQARAVLVQRDGRIVAAGRAVLGAVDNFALARYLAAGHS
jgi:uncharacterized delta-60 repeat protein